MVNLRESEPATLRTDIFAQKVAFTITDWAPDYIDPQNFLSMLLRTGSRLNFSGYSNPRFDAIGERLLATVEVNERARLHGELIAEGMGDVALMPVFWPVRTVLSLSRVRGIKEPNTANILEWDITPA